MSGNGTAGPALHPRSPGPLSSAPCPLRADLRHLSATRPVLAPDHKACPLLGTPPCTPILSHCPPAWLHWHGGPRTFALTTDCPSPTPKVHLLFQVSLSHSLGDICPLSPQSPAPGPASFLHGTPSVPLEAGVSVWTQRPCPADWGDQGRQDTALPLLLGVTLDPRSRTTILGWRCPRNGVRGPGRRGHAAAGQAAGPTAGTQLQTWTPNPSVGTRRPGRRCDREGLRV
jgi:hypothetical protein